MARVNHRRKSRVKRCKRCRREFRKRLFAPGVFGSYCQRFICQDEAKERAQLNDAVHRLNGPDPRKASGYDSKAVAFGSRYGTMGAPNLAAIRARVFDTLSKKQHVIEPDESEEFSYVPPTELDTTEDE